MPDRPPNKPIGTAARWLMPSLHSYCVLIVLVALVHESWRFLGDSDTGWHIRTGEWILRTHAVPRQDLFSFTMQGREWFAWEWLSDVLLATAHQLGGLATVVAGAILVLVVSFGALHRLMICRSSDPLLALLVTSLGAVATMVHWLARPHVLSILLMIIWYASVEDYRRTRSRWIYLTPLLVAVWANLHGAFVLTFLILAIYLAGEMVEFALRGRLRSSELRAAMWTYGLVGMLSVLAALATPYGATLYGHLWNYLTDRDLLAAVSEFQSPNFQTTNGKIIEVLLFLGAVGAALALRQGRVIEAGLFLLLGHMTLQSERHVTMAVVLLAPFIAEQWTGLMRTGSAWIGNREGPVARRFRALHEGYRGFLTLDRQLRGLVVYPLAVIFLLVAVKGPWVDRLLTPHFDPKKFPVGAADFIAAGPPEGNMYAHDQFGGYFIYRLYPRIKVFADGRADLYRQSTVFNDELTLAMLRPAWSEVLDRNDVTWMVLKRDAPLALLAEMSGSWTNAYMDATARVMIRRNPLPEKVTRFTP